uniref:Adenylosuccinate lyase n=1 Tax=Timspurckia oligopyrenoides TaxID=708627 RepID=A0A7S0ZDK9_9RHOD|mmetsp:Transcript_13694/g.24561  ORF Transcript_13694/g.24561 Transcript_13694/m.24561 type:complete len:458 (+) Transcript_13694:111-1484(+)
MELSELTAISPIDGRYSGKTGSLRGYFSEFALIRNRCRVEIEWLKVLCSGPNVFDEIPRLSSSSVSKLDLFITQFDIDSASKVKKIESTTRHDVKAVEYFLKSQLESHSDLVPVLEFVHFTCTSEDINNLSWALSLKDSREAVLLPAMDKLILALKKRAREFADIPMLSRTHGQSATPTTLGKEFQNVVKRLEIQRSHYANIPIRGKFNGAVGNFNAALVAFPTVDWIAVSKQLVESLGLEYSLHTTQIEPHDYIAELFDTVSRFNTILLDFSRDMWTYISLGYFNQMRLDGEVGSSTMPHKLNPIDFENAEGNIGIAEAMMHHMARKLPISRMQRDLSDSTVLRNLGVGYAHALIAYSSLTFGLSKVNPNRELIVEELSQHWELLAEPIQTVMRKYGLETPYEQLKLLTQGKVVTRETIVQFINLIPEKLPQSEREMLLQLTPQSYLGIAPSLAKQ